MNRDLIKLVWKRANSACEYCQVPQSRDALTFEIDHVLAVGHGGQTAASNLALSCFLCNRHKGPNLVGVDPLSGKVTKLFHPRRHAWHRHFSWEDACLVGRTAIGRTTVRVLHINDYLRLRHRDALIAERVFPPKRK